MATNRSATPEYNDLLQRYRELEERLREADETLRAIRCGEVDALVSAGPDGDCVYTLRGADEPYRVIVQGMAEGALTLTLDGLILFANEQFASMIGVALERVIGSRFDEHIAAEDAGLLNAILSRAESRKAELNLRTRAGSLVPVYLSADNLIVSESECICLIVTDLTEQKRNEQIVAEEKLARSILEQAAEAIVVVDPDGRISRANRASSLLTGGSVEHRDFDEVLQIRLASGEPLRFAQILQWAKKEKSVSGLEATASVAGGRKIDLLLSAAVLTGPDSDVLGCVLTLIDITDRNRRERELEFQADILKATTEAVVAIDAEQRITFWNAAAERMYGVSRADAVGAPLTSVYQYRWVEEEEQGRAETALRTDATWSGENTHIRRDGSELAVSSTVNRMSEKHGGGMFAVIRDITERRKAEAAARASDLQFRILADSIPQLAWMTDANGSITWYNSRWYEYTGSTPEEMVGWGWAKVHHPEHVERVVGLWKRKLDEGVEWEDTFPLLGKDGQYRWFLSRALPIRNSDGQIVRWFGTNTDITERRVVEEALRKSEARFRRLYEADIIGIACGDSERIFEANDVLLKMLGYTRAELEPNGILWRDVTAPGTVHPDERQLAELNAGGCCRPIEKEYLRRDGTIVPVLTAATVLETSPEQWLCLVLDLTERKGLESKLLEKQKLESIGLLAGGIAHDFNNLLVGMMGNAALAQEVLPASSPAQEFLGWVVEASERAAHLTRQMLAYSGKGRFVIEQVDLSKLTRQVTELVQSSISKRVSIDFDFVRNLPCVEGDAGQLQQVIMNLVINAAEAIGDRTGKIAIRTGSRVLAEKYALPDGTELEPGPYVVLEVADDGEGMDENTRQKIFDPFFTTKFTGRGLGLAAVAGIIRGHRGAIEVTSAPGAGSRFTVLFRASMKAPGKEQPAVKRPGPHVESDGVTVLLVDDEPTVLRVATTALETKGFTVLQAQDGPAAIDVLRREKDRVAVVVLDLSMPGMNGHDTLPHLRRIKPDVAVIVSSGYSEHETLRIFSGQDISGFLQKPYTSSVLVDKIAGALVHA